MVMIRVSIGAQGRQELVGKYSANRRKRADQQGRLPNPAVTYSGMTESTSLEKMVCAIAIRLVMLMLMAPTKSTNDGDG